MPARLPDGGTAERGDPRPEESAKRAHALGSPVREVWSIYFGTVLLGKVDERDMIIRD